MIHPRRRIIPRRPTIPLCGAVGTPITVAITLVEQQEILTLTLIRRHYFMRTDEGLTIPHSVLARADEVIE